MVDDPSRNPEVDSFEYMHMIFEALNRMGRLDVAIDRIEQRLPIELFAVVDRTNQEVDVRHPAHLRHVEGIGRAKRLTGLDNVTGGDGILHDLLYTLYSKFEAIAEGHRAVHEVVAGIVAREGLRGSNGLLGGFKELWKLYQSEVGIFRIFHIHVLILIVDRCAHYFMTILRQMETHCTIQELSLPSIRTFSAAISVTKTRYFTSKTLLSVTGQK